MKPIKDIRIYKSRIPNINGNPLPSECHFTNDPHCAAIRRITMKLNERGFSLGDFDHLYINFTTCAVEGGVALAKRSADTYHPWFRYMDIHIDDALYDKLDGTESEADFCEILRLLEVALNKAASPDDPKAAATIHAAVEEALELGEQMRVRYKEKQATTRRAVIFLRCADDGWFFPLLQVYGSEGVLPFETDLPKTIDLMSLGEIQVSTKRVTVKPRQNSIAEYLGLKPISFHY